MPFDLCGAQGGLQLTVHEWVYALELAVENGWDPIGTRPSHDFCDDERACIEGRCDTAQSWEGCYASNNRQEVTAQDAAALADALERGLLQLPREDLLADQRRPVPGYPQVGMIPAEADISPREWFSGGRGDVLQDLIVLCRQGSFSIW
jgi:hypothetical protein